MSGTGTCQIEISSLKLTDESENCGASHGYNSIMERLVNDEHLRYDFDTPGVVSLTFHELPEIFSRKYTTPEITFMVTI